MPQGGADYVWRRACIACTKSKRQCTKQIPACRRCARKEIPCKYLPARRAASRPASGDCDETSAAASGSTSAPSTGSAAATAASSNSAFLPLMLPQADIGDVPSSEEVSCQSYSTTAVVLSTGTWFLSPEAWISDHSIAPGKDCAATLGEGHLNCFLDSAQRWHRQWVAEGESPLHHPRLYQYCGEMPRRVEDAYTALATTYSAETPRAREIARQIINDRVTQLMREQALETSLTGASRDPFAHLSRVQALLAYQVVRLFDGDIRMRAQAEALIPTLRDWCKEMWESAKTIMMTATPDGAFVPLSSGELELGIEPDPHVATWRTWIVAESIRRAWLAANYVQNTYLHLKLGWSECPGRIQFTMRRGLWNLQSGYAWSRACEDHDALFMQPSRISDLFTEISPSDVDDFAHAALTIEYGMERMEKWCGEKSEKSNAPALPSLDFAHNFGRFTY